MISCKRSCLYTTVTCFLWTQAAAAAVPANKLGETASLVSAIAKVLGALAVVVALMFLLLFTLKKLGLGNGMAKSGSNIKIIETRMIAPKKYIAIAQIAGKQVALGITDHNISLLTDLDDQLISPVNEKSAGSDSFAGVLQKAASYLKKTPKHQESTR
jgi:flagellar biosynthetic protein FliO